VHTYSLGQLHYKTHSAHMILVRGCRLRVKRQIQFANSFQRPPLLLDPREDRFPSQRMSFVKLVDILGCHFNRAVRGI
jgi:hypothetical protein